MVNLPGEMTAWMIHVSNIFENWKRQALDADITLMLEVKRLEKQDTAILEGS